jgi:hypothetical protein
MVHDVTYPPPSVPIYRSHFVQTSAISIWKGNLTSFSMLDCGGMNLFTNGCNTSDLLTWETNLQQLNYKTKLVLQVGLDDNSQLKAGNS